jgi:hypothetical protein
MELIAGDVEGVHCADLQVRLAHPPISAASTTRDEQGLHWTAKSEDPRHVATAVDLATCKASRPCAVML